MWELAIMWEFCLKFSLANIGNTLRFATHIYWFVELFVVIKFVYSEVMS